MILNQAAKGGAIFRYQVLVRYSDCHARKKKKIERDTRVEVNKGTISSVNTA